MSDAQDTHTCVRVAEFFRAVIHLLRASLARADAAQADTVPRSKPDVAGRRTFAPRIPRSPIYEQTKEKKITITLHNSCFSLGYYL